MERRPSGAALVPPPGLVVDTFELGDHRFAVLDWPVEPRRPVATLTPAGREILELLLAGHSNAAIARRRRRSVRTVAHQVDSIFRRLGVRSRLELFALCSRHGSDGPDSGRGTRR
jgi:DNA-binding NarL/FixJ family response regulator